MRMHPLAVIAAFLIPATAAAAAAGVERWSAASTTAIGITGNILLSPSLLTAAGRSLPLAVEADVSSFPINGSNAPARILRVIRPADPLLLHGNHLCGSPARWIVAQRGTSRKELTLAVFSSVSRPTSDSDQGLCGTFGYTR